MTWPSSPRPRIATARPMIAMPSGSSAAATDPNATSRMTSAASRPRPSERRLVSWSSTWAKASAAVTVMPASPVARSTRCSSRVASALVMSLPATESVTLIVPVRSSSESRPLYAVGATRRGDLGLGGERWARGREGHADSCVVSESAAHHEALRRVPRIRERGARGVDRCLTVGAGDGDVVGGRGSQPRDGEPAHQRHEQPCADHAARVPTRSSDPAAPSTTARVPRAAAPARSSYPARPYSTLVQ